VSVGVGVGVRDGVGVGVGARVRVAVRVQVGLGFDLGRRAEVLAEAVAGGALDSTSRRGDIGLDRGGVVAARELFGFGFG